MAKAQNTEGQEDTAEIKTPAAPEAAPVVEGVPIGAVVDAAEATGGQYVSVGAGKLKRVA